MKQVALIIFLSMFSFLYAGELKKLTFEQAYLGEGEEIFTPLPTITGWIDDTHYFQLEQGKLFKVHAPSGRKQLALDPTAPSHTETLKPLGESVNLLDTLDRTDDLNKFLFMKEGDIFLFQRGINRLVRITESKGEEKNPTFSLDGTKIAPKSPIRWMGTFMFINWIPKKNLNSACPFFSEKRDVKSITGRVQVFEKT